MRATRDSTRIGPTRGGSIICATSAALHLARGFGHGSSLVVMGVVLAMSLLCLSCGVELWRLGNWGAWLMALVVNAGMVASHPLLGLIDDAHSTHGMGTAMILATVLAGIMTVGSAVVLVWFSRRGPGTPAAVEAGPGSLRNGN